MRLPSNVFSPAILFMSLMLLAVQPSSAQIPGVSSAAKAACFDTKNKLVSCGGGFVATSGSTVYDCVCNCSGSDQCTPRTQSEKNSQTEKKADIGMSGNTAAVDAAAAQARRDEAVLDKASRETFVGNRDTLVRSLKGNAADKASTRPMDLKDSASVPRLGLKPSTPTAQVNAAAEVGSEHLPTPLQPFYTTEMRTFLPMNDGGHPIDATEPPPKDGNGLVGGTTWTFGFKQPHATCGARCKTEMDKRLKLQLRAYCGQQGDAEAVARCLKADFPFNPDLYSMVLSMGSYNTALYDLATRVVFDGATYGEYSRQHKEIFSSLKGRQFNLLDCHSNGAMLCLAALRAGDTTAKEVRLFGPQISPQAAKMWQDYSRRTGTPITIYLNSADPVASISWLLPTPAPQTENTWSSTPNVWLYKAVAVPGNLAVAAFNSYLDGETGVMNRALEEYGFTVVRSKCESVISLRKFIDRAIDCHSMREYEKHLVTELPAPPKWIPKK